MEARRLLILLAAVVLIRLPFLDHPIQGDDVYYLAIARNVPVDPLHPMQMGYTFQGDRVSMAGHPHPPLNAYILALLIQIFGNIREVPFHAAYLVFSLAAVGAMYRLARRFTDRPLLAGTLFLSVPAFLVNGNSLESDLPFLAFWMAGFAFYFDGRHRLAAGSLALAAMAAYQAVFAMPILAHHAWYHRRRSKTAWLAVVAAPLTIGVWQAIQIATTGQLPASVLTGYLQSYGLLAAVMKLRSAVALTGHLGWLSFPIGLLPGLIVADALLAVSLATGVAVLLRWLVLLWRDRRTDDGFLAAWGLVFFAGAVAVFFAGSARYLLPLTPAVIFTVLRWLPRPWLLWPVAVLNLALGLTMASANYHHWDQYRGFAAGLPPLLGDRRVWTNAEWGLRYYLERLGAEPLQRDQPVYPGQVVVTSAMAGRIPFTTAGGPRQELVHADLHSRRPIRLFGLGSRSGYSSSEHGLLPFEPGRGPLDLLKAELIGVPNPRLSWLRMNDPEAAGQLLSGFYDVEDKSWRWMAEQGLVLLQAPAEATRFEMTFFIPDAAPARQVTIAVNGLAVISQTYAAPGRYTITAPVSITGAAQILLSVDRSFQTPTDRRRLGIIVQELGLR
jgi:hypothetical protein